MTTELVEQLILAVHLLLALAIIGLIMLQQGKGAEMGASFGAGASQTLFGSSGSGNVLTRATAWLVALFFATSFGLAVIATQKTRTEAFDIPLPVPAERTAVDTPAAAGAGAADDLPSVDSAEPALRSGDVPAADDLPVLENE